MALDFINGPAFPDVPAALGVPPVARIIGGVIDLGPAALLGDVISLGLVALGQWGLFSQFGVPVLVGNTVVGMEYKNDWRIATAPQEQGAFESYNKVANPFTARLTYAIGGTRIERALFLNLLDTVAKSLLLYTVVTPEIFYPSANIVNYEYRREAKNGATLLTVDIFVQEVRVTGSAQFSQTQQPNGANPVATGTVQGITPDPAAPQVPNTQGVVTQYPLPPPSPPSPSDNFNPIPASVYLPPGATT